MPNDKGLYFIPLLSKALESEDPARAMSDAFREIRLLGAQPAYKEGFRQFVAFTHSTIKPSGEDLEPKIQRIREAVYQLIFSLATNTFAGDEEQKDSIIRALNNIPEWHTEFERINAEAKDFLDQEIPIEVEVLKEKRIIASVSISSVASSLSPVSPGNYLFRFSNGRALWEGEIKKEDLIWAFAYPEKDLPMAAETESSKEKSTRSISLLNGELIIHIFAGLEMGELRFEYGKTL